MERRVLIYDLMASFTSSLISSGFTGKAFCDWLYMTIRVTWMTPTTPRKKLTAARLGETRLAPWSQPGKEGGGDTHR